MTSETESAVSAAPPEAAAQTSESEHAPLVRTRDEHSISRRDIDPDALKVLYRLARNGYIAYLVGGGVRDLLLGRKPKDFDVSTNARPEQIRALFRNCILIGRRFRLAHVRYGDKIIETSTFRSTPRQSADPADPEADLFQRDDNLFGTPQEDALRRDFTVNGLFYDIETFSIIDYVGGMEDLAARRIRSIGDPCIRFREDPVRMIRAVRFASRLDFTLDPETEDAIRKHGEELAKAAPARLLEEIIRLFAFASGEKAVRLLVSTGLLKVILPEVAAAFDSEKIDNGLFWKRLRALDEGDTVLPDATPALIFAVLLQDALKLKLGRGWTFDESPRLHFDKVHAFLEPLALRLKFPRKLVDRIVHMYITQHRFAHPGNRGKRGSIANFVTQDAFHEALALAEITVSAEAGDQMVLNHWRDMLAERIYGRDDQPGHGNGNGHSNHNGHNGHNGNARPERPAPGRVAAEVVEAVEEGGDDHDREHDEHDFAGKRISRSARRRRNKRMRRMHMQEGDGIVAAEAAPASSAAQGGGESPEAVEHAESAPSVEKKHSRGNRRGRSWKERGERRNGGHGGEQSGEKQEEEVIRPLTAAAFWAPPPAPEPVPEPEPEPAAEPEKKRRGRKPRGGGKASKSKKDPRADAESGASGADELPPKPKSPAMDKADEADIPMHWLDEI